MQLTLYQQKLISNIFKKSDKPFAEAHSVGRCLLCGVQQGP